MFHARNNVACSSNCKYRTVAKLCILDTSFVSGTMYIIVNTLLKGDKKDDDDDDDDDNDNDNLFTY